MLKIPRCMTSFLRCTFLLYVFTFCLILPYAGRDLVFSLFSSLYWTKSSLQSKVLEDNRVEYEAAVSYLETRRRLGQPKIQAVHDRLHMAVVVVTVPRTIGRQSLGYLTRTVASIDSLLLDHQPYDISLIVCNVNAGPGPHRELDDLRHTFHVIERFPNGSAAAAITDPFEKEKQDYAFCMQQALDFGPELVLVVEDDAVARPDLFRVIRWILSSERTQHDAADRRSYIKLFYPERWQGYSVNSRSILELASIFLLGGTVGQAMTSCCSRRRLSRIGRQTPYLWQFIAAGLYCVLLAMSIGRQHLIALKRLFISLHSLTSAPACCSPAILYFSGFASKLIRHLSHEVRCSSNLPLDIAIDSFAAAEHSIRYLVEPNLFRHIGFLSTMKGYSKYPEEFLV